MYNIPNLNFGMLHQVSRMSSGPRKIIAKTLFRLDSDRGKGVPSFDEMMDFALVEVDFDDPTTNVRGRRALAIAKPISRGYWPRRCMINLTTKVYSCKQSKNEQEYDKAIWILQIYMKALLIKVGFCDAFVWSLNTNEVREVAAMANF